MEKAKLNVVHFEEDVIATSGCTHDLYCFSDYEDKAVILVKYQCTNGVYSPTSETVTVPVWDGVEYSDMGGHFFSKDITDENCVFDDLIPYYDELGYYDVTYRHNIKQ